MKIFFVYSSHYSEILKEENVRVLFSYPYMRDAYKRAPQLPSGFTNEIVIDSGGFSLHQKTAEVYVKAYALWLNLLLPKYTNISGYFNLDIIGDPIRTMENQFYLESQGLHPIPTYHDGEPEEFLRFYCDNYPWVSVGGLVGKKPGRQYLVKLCNWLHQTYSETKFHLFGIGIGGSSAFKQMRPYSIDFSTWSSGARFGDAVLLDKKQIIKKYPLTENERERLRTDSDFLGKITRQSVRNIKYFEDTINKLEKTEHQLILKLRG